MSQKSLIDPSFYETVTVSMVGGTSQYTGSSEVTCTRIGNVVTLTTNVMTHASTYVASSGDVVLPPSMRPTKGWHYNCYISDLGTTFKTIEINTAGRIRTWYFSSGTQWNLTSTGSAITISYVVD